jgi:D-alanyl-lipoteichoic acid acyltransferase DltB (MBOAT superfamily)
MLFSSVEFIFVFLPITVLLYYALGRKSHKYRNTILVLASLFFYGFWKPVYLPLIIISVLINFSFGRLISIENDRAHSKMFLVIGICLNVGLLGVFKYSDFFIGNINTWLEPSIEPLGLILPLAISFFTFQQIAYLVDSYKGMAKDYKVADYFLFVTFFPQLIAGPIVHHKEMMPQFSSNKSSYFNVSNVAQGVIIFSIGLFKKIVIADHFGAYSDLGYGHVENLNFLGAWSTSLAYTTQLYYDFSGYCDMAIGAALLFNIRLPINFNSPYKATSIQDFWRRWHITLSNWLRDYLYIPLGGNKKGSIKTYRNLIITFLIGGFWHGAGWGFILWGLIHGVGLTIHRLWQNTGVNITKVMGWFMTIMFVHFAWVPFRAEDLSDAFTVTSKMLNPFDGSLTISLFQSMYSLGLDQLNGSYIALTAGACILFSAIAKNSIEITANYEERPNSIALIAGMSFVLGVIVMVGSSSQTFLYFNF